MVKYILSSDTGGYSTITSEYVPLKNDTFFCVNEVWKVRDVVRILKSDGNMLIEAYCSKVLEKRNKIKKA